MDIKLLYTKRFTSLERIRKKKLWQILCRDFLQNFINPQHTVVDLGAGGCEFINNIRCKKKIAVDLTSETVRCADSNVEVISTSARHIKKILKDKSVDTIFMSNFLEHLDGKEEIFRLLQECHDILNFGGQLLIMQPDIVRVGNSYWDFFDHKMPLTEKSLLEVLSAIGFKIKYLRSPFLPYSTKLRFIPLSANLLRLYLHLRPLQLIFGKQFFVCAQKLKKERLK